MPGLTYTEWLRESTCSYVEFYVTTNWVVPLNLPEVVYCPNLCIMYSSIFSYGNLLRCSVIQCLHKYRHSDAYWLPIFRSTSRLKVRAYMYIALSGHVITVHVIVGYYKDRWQEAILSIGVGSNFTLGGGGGGGWSCRLPYAQAAPS